MENMRTDAELRAANRAAEWRSRLAILVMGLLVFETLSGLAIYLLPFSLSVQFAVLIHTGAGLLFVVPYGWYQVRHWAMYRQGGLTHVKLTGYLSLLATALCGISGLVLTWQAAFDRRIDYGWDTLHLITTFALIAFALPHVGVLVLRGWRGEGGAVLAAARRRFGLGTAVVTLILAAAVGAWSLLYRPVEFANVFPPDYNLSYGGDRPFAPSLASTATGGAYDPRSLSGSKSCGTSGCHEEIVAEWEPSAHRYASMDVAFQAVQNEMAKQNGAESTRYCGGCHDPISLFSGTKNIFAENLTGLVGYQEGISCLVCHAIQKTDIKGNADYTVQQPERYAYELEEDAGAAGLFARDFLIRSYPRQHVESLSHRLFKSPEFCAACHKQFIDAEINKVGWVQLQNQYDNWRKSHWNHPGEPGKTIECRECHMPLVADSKDPGSGDPLDYNRSAADGKHRSHRFLGANQFIPIIQKLPGGEEHVRLTEQWLRGELEIPEIADKWAQGPAVPIELVAPARVAPGAQVALKVNLASNKVGHDFPTGPLDIIQAWVELTVKDEAGNLVYQSGALDERHFIEPGSFIFKAEPVDQYGNLIDRHNLWEMVGVRFKRSLFPGFGDAADYSFHCPGGSSVGSTPLTPTQQHQFSTPQAKGKLYVEAKLQYRKIDQFLLNFLMGEASGLTTPVTTISQDSKVIEVVPGHLGMTAPAQTGG